MESVNGFSARELQAIYSRTGCSDPGILRLDMKLLLRFHPEWSAKVKWKYLHVLGELLGIRNPVEIVRWHLLLGDRSPAIVASETPLIVAAYSEEQDGIVMLKFDERQVDPKFRRVGTLLTTLNLDYSDRHGPLAADLRPGPKSAGRWTNFLPLIGEFLSRDTERLAQLKATIPNSWWRRLADLVHNYDYDNGVRDGRPGYAAQPAVGDRIWRMIDRGS
jgi:hypothetical protein